MAFWGTVLQRYHIDYGTLERRVLTFALDGKAELPAKIDPTWTKPSDPDFVADPEMVHAGSELFNGRCAVCHGFAAVSAGFAPDLRRSAVPLSQGAFEAVVRGGALLPKGMPKFDTLTSADLS